MADNENIEDEATATVHTRGYQQEMLEESLRNNIVIALDTGAGKTHIAVLRMKLEAERETRKLSWFLAPTVALVEQQRDVIASAIPVSVGIISGEAEPDQWTDYALWRNILDTHRIMVTTPQPLYDALTHGYIDLGRDIGLLVFDEAHHAVRKHPYNMIMKQFYFKLPRRGSDDDSVNRVRPQILGLTASPIYGGNVDKAFSDLEQNLDCVIRSSRLNRDELANHVHRPVFNHVLYSSPTYGWGDLPSRNVHALKSVLSRMNIENDPYVKSLHSRLEKLQPGPERNSVDQKLSKTLSKEDTFTHRGLRDFERAAEEICMELGIWAADWYVAKVVEVAKVAANPHNNYMSAWQEKEKAYLLSALVQVQLEIVSSQPDDIRAACSPKVLSLVQCLLAEEANFQSFDESYSGLIFVTRRDSVLALAEILSRLPEISEKFQIGCLLGSSTSSRRHAFLDITRHMLKNSQSETLRDFKIGDKNLIVSTSVAEEGIDIQACGSVIRFDPPPNVVAWAQSRGRARRRRSSFIMMFENDGGHRPLVQQWEQTELRMQALYLEERAALQAQPNDDDDDDETDDVAYWVESTGAILTLHSATSHLNHFCAVLPNAGYGGHDAVFDLDPPDFPEGWHLNQTQLPPYEGPWGATVTLPRSVSASLRTFSSVRVYRSKRSALRHVAFNAYVELHKAGLLNDNLLPLTSAIEEDKGEEVKKLLEEVEKRASTEKVAIQMDPWLSPAKDDDAWFCSRLTIDGLPELYMLTHKPMPFLHDHEFPFLFVPGKEPLRISVKYQKGFPINAAFVERARRYTRQIFAILCSQRMDPEDTSFTYLFLPIVLSEQEKCWNERRKWMQDRMSAVSELCIFESAERANADTLGKRFSRPNDLTLIRSGEKFNKLLRFIEWTYNDLTEEQEAELLKRYEGFLDVDPTYTPLIMAQPFPRRVNFLLPLFSETEGLGQDRPVLLHPKHVTVELVSGPDVQYAMLLPSVLRWLSNALTVLSMRSELLFGSAVARVPLDLLVEATTAPVSQEATNYQRLETLGDTVLKFIASMQVFADHPLWHQGYLSRRKDHVISNQSLAQAAISKGLYKWIIRDRFAPKTWKPRYSNDSYVPRTPTSPSMPKDSNKKERTQELSTKLLADVVESLIGASYKSGGFDAAIDCARLFDLDLNWKTIPVRIQDILAQTEEHIDPPSQLGIVERMLNYQFTRKTFLIQALTHGSYHGELASMSYERLEFLGDAALDMVVTNYIYDAPGKNYSPGHMHLRKEAVVNAHFLAFICMNTSLEFEGAMPTWTHEGDVALEADRQQIYLYRFLMHSSHRVLEDQSVTFARFEKSGPVIAHALKHDSIYPWAALTSLQAPKFLSDMIESLLGAVYLDSEGSLEAVTKVMRTLGIMDALERIVEGNVDVLHPVSRLQEWADRQDPQQEVEYEMTKTKLEITCTIKVGGEVVASVTELWRSRVSQQQVKFAAAELAIKNLHVRDEITVDVDYDDDWDDLPEEMPW
ncbi:P-loop containing nucleoside triphosphate hydrolase protein [Sparassis latifolia]